MQSLNRNSSPAHLIPGDVAATLVDPTAYATPALERAYAWLRQNEPLGLACPDGFDPFWVVTKHADILEVSRNNAGFPSGARATVLNDKIACARAIEITGAPNLLRNLIQMDEPDHMKYRLLTQAWFAPAQLRRREEQVARLAREAVDQMLSLGRRCDFVGDVALHYPLKVVMEILGVPPKDFPRMLRLTQQLFGPQDPDTRRAAASRSTAEYSAMIQAVIDDFGDYFEAISAERRREPRDDMATLIAQATIDGAPIPRHEAVSYFILVATAGHDTTSSSTAAGMWALATVPGLLAQLKADPGHIPAFVDEAVRWATPVKTFMRSASVDTELRGRTIRANDWLMLCYLSGNRDEEVFEAPAEFRIDRKPNKQLAFGSGAHVCLGQHLAKMEMRLFFETLLPRLRGVGLSGEPKYIESWFVNGLKHLPIEFEIEPG